MFVAIEGIDGSGKGTVTKELYDLLVSNDYKVDTLSFPRYGETLYGKLVGRYLNGEFGENTHPYLHGTLYSMDRLESKPFLEAAIAYNDVVLCDRYIPSNLCYSALKAKKEERDEVVKHFVQLEYEIMKMPVPDVIFFLDVPVKFAVQNIAKKAARDYTDRTADIHEADENYLSQVRVFYGSTLMKYHPQTCFETIECERNGHLLSIDKIVDKVHTLLIPMMRKN
jgi:dTMP kinase